MRGEFLKTIMGTTILYDFRPFLKVLSFDVIFVYIQLLQTNIAGYNHVVCNKITTNGYKVKTMRNKKKIC